MTWAAVLSIVWLWLRAFDAQPPSEINRVLCNSQSAGRPLSPGSITSACRVSAAVRYDSCGEHGRQCPVAGGLRLEGQTGLGAKVSRLGDNRYVVFGFGMRGVPWTGRVWSAVCSPNNKYHACFSGSVASVALTRALYYWYGVRAESRISLFSVM